MNREQFRERLTEYVMQSNLTRAEIAKRAHIAPSTLSAYLSGKALPSVSVLARLKAVLGLRVDYLLGLTDERG